MVSEVAVAGDAMRREGGVVVVPPRRLAPSVPRGEDDEVGRALGAVLGDDGEAPIESLVSLNQVDDPLTAVDDLDLRRQLARSTMRR